MKVLTYEFEKMKEAGKILNSVEVSGAENFRLLARLADILDSGTLGEMEIKEGKGDKK